MTDTFQIGDRCIGEHALPYVIAEIGVNHDGSVDRAIQLVREAAAAGADAVKFQWFRADDLVAAGTETAEYQLVQGEDDQHSLLKGLELEAAQMAQVVDLAHSLEMHAITTVFCESLVEDARKLPWDAWKVASPDLVHRPLLERLGDDGRPIILSTGAATLEEVLRAQSWLPNAHVSFLQCLSAYPAEEAEASLSGIAVLASATGRQCGYSDHTIEETTGGLAVAAGATILEKHFTYSTDARGPDHAASLQPDGLARYIQFAHRAHRAMGPRGEKAPQSSESNVRVVSRQSLRAARTLIAGDVLECDDLHIKRPADGLEPWKLEMVVGRTLTRSLQSDEPITSEDLA